MKEREVVSRRFLESRSDRAKALEVVKEDLNSVPSSVASAIQARLALPGGICVNYGLDAK